MEKASEFAGVNPFGDEFFSLYGIPVMDDVYDTDTDTDISNPQMDNNVSGMSSDLSNGRGNLDNVFRIRIDNTNDLRDSSTNQRTNSTNQKTNSTNQGTNSTNQETVVIPVVTQKLRNPRNAANELPRPSSEVPNMQTSDDALAVSGLDGLAKGENKPVSVSGSHLVPGTDYSSRKQSQSSTNSDVVKPLEASLRDFGDSKNTVRDNDVVKRTENVDENVVNIEVDDEPIDKEVAENASKRKVTSMKRGPVAKSIFVRFLLICHNVMTVWRVLTVYDNDIYWLLVLTNLLVIAEGAVVIMRRQGIEYTWWCPCFLVYLLSTLPLIWLLQLNQHYVLTDQINQSSLANQSPTSKPYITTTDSKPNRMETSYSSALTSTVTSVSPSIASSASTSFANVTTAVWSINITSHSETFNVSATTSTLDNNVSASSLSSLASSGISSTTTPDFTSPTGHHSLNASNTSFVTNISTNHPVTTESAMNVSTSTEITSASNQNTTTDSSPNNSQKQAGFSGSLNESQIWVIIVEEALVYLLVFCRWLLPRGEVSREFLADLLLEFLAIASDIMELLAIFDEDVVRANLVLTHWIMGVWSASFIQFVPILMQKRRFRHVRNPNVKWMTRACGDKFVEILVMCMSIFLQDGPFLVLRLYVMIQMRIITYSLVFFVLKNMVTLMLLSYRMAITCYRLPCYRRAKRKPKSKKAA